MNPASRPGHRIGGLALVAVSAVWACADTVRPVAGRLHLGLRGGSFRVPVPENESSPFRYPRSAWQRGVGGECRLRIHISRQGTVDSAYVLESSGHSALDSAALVGARRLRYRPAMQGGETVAVWAVLPVRFPMPEEVDEP